MFRHSVLSGHSEIKRVTILGVFQKLHHLLTSDTMSCPRMLEKQTKGSILNWFKVVWNQGRLPNPSLDFKGLRRVGCMKFESLPIEGIRMDAQERILGKGGWDRHPNPAYR